MSSEEDSAAGRRSALRVLRQAPGPHRGGEGAPGDSWGPHLRSKRAGSWVQPPPAHWAGWGHRGKDPLLRIQRQPQFNTGCKKPSPSLRVSGVEGIWAIWSTSGTASSQRLRVPHSQVNIEARFALSEPSQTVLAERMPSWPPPLASLCCLFPEGSPGGPSGCPHLEPRLSSPEA